jgi:hypothetical protein
MPTPVLNAEGATEELLRLKHHGCWNFYSFIVIYIFSIFLLAFFFSGW